MTTSRSTARRNLAIALLALSALLALASSAAATSAATTLLRENRPLPGGPPLELITGFSNTAVNHGSGYAAIVTTTGPGGTLSHVWGNGGGGGGGLIRTEATFGTLVQTSFESFFGISDAGLVSYSASGTGGPVGGFDSEWLDDTPIAVEGNPIPSMPGQYWRFASRPGVSASGEPYWVGGITNTPGGATQNRVLFYGTGATVVLAGLTTPAGLPAAITNGGISFDYRFSALGNHYITPVIMQTGSSLHDDAMLMDGAGLFAGGDLVREQRLVPPSVGGLPSENWDNFGYCGVTNTGQYFFTGDTEPATANDGFLFKNGHILYREGDALGGEVLSGTVSAAYMNENADIAFVWPIQGGTKRALFVNDMLLLRQGEPVDLSGDGVVEPTSLLGSFTGINALTVSDRDALGNVKVYFTADVDTAGTPATSADDIGAYLCMTTNVEPPIAVTLQEFSALAVDEGVRLAWRTAREANHDGFHVYRRRSDNGTWERLTSELVRGGSPYSYVDRDVEPNATYSYRLGAVDRSGREELLGLVTVLAGRGTWITQLHPGLPNPFTSSTEVSFALAQSGAARVSIYDASGRLVRHLVDATLPAGRHVRRWDGRDDLGRSVTNGVYWSQLDAGGRTQTQKMTLVRP